MRGGQQQRKNAAGRKSAVVVKATAVRALGLLSFCSGSFSSFWFGWFLVLLNLSLWPHDDDHGDVVVVLMML